MRAVLLVAVLVGTSCTVAAPAPTTDPLAGHYVVKGGGAPSDRFQALAAVFALRHPGVKWEFEDVGSAAGIRLVAAGAADLGLSSSEPSDAFKDRVLLLSIGVSGTAVVVPVASPVRGLSKQQIRDIFAGTLTDWAATGGKPGQIEVVVRQPSSAIRSNFEDYFFAGSGTITSSAIVVGDAGEMVSVLRSRGGSIGMLTVDHSTLADPTIRLLAVDGVVPTQDRLASGEYKVRRPLFLVYHPTEVKPAVQAFLDFVRGPDGQRIIAER